MELVLSADDALIGYGSRAEQGEPIASVGLESDGSLALKASLVRLPAVDALDVTIPGVESLSIALEVI